MTDQIDLWCGEFGNQYHKRNVAVAVARKVGLHNLWTWVFNFIDDEKPMNILEIGAGTGANLDLIANLRIDDRLNAVEVNKEAAFQLFNNRNVMRVWNCSWQDARIESFKHDKYDIVFTSGVLIHVHPNDRIEFMQKIVDVGSKWIVAIEYMSNETKEILYRGEKSALWSGDYRMHYENFGLECVGEKYFSKDSGLDDVKAIIMRKK